MWSSALDDSSGWRPPDVGFAARLSSTAPELDGGSLMNAPGAGIARPPAHLRDHFRTHLSLNRTLTRAVSEARSPSISKSKDLDDEPCISVDESSLRPEEVDMAGSIAASARPGFKLALAIVVGLVLSHPALLDLAAGLRPADRSRTRRPLRSPRAGARRRRWPGRCWSFPIARPRPRRWSRTARASPAAATWCAS